MIEWMRWIDPMNCVSLFSTCAVCPPPAHPQTNWLLTLDCRKIPQVGVEHISCTVRLSSLHYVDSEIPKFPNIPNKSGSILRARTFHSVQTSYSSNKDLEQAYRECSWYCQWSILWDYFSNRKGLKGENNKKKNSWNKVRTIGHCKVHRLPRSCSWPASVKMMQITVQAEQLQDKSRLPKWYTGWGDTAGIY